MSAQHSVTLTCDDCATVLTVPVQTIPEARADAWRIGWSSYRKSDTLAVTLLDRCEGCQF